MAIDNAQPALPVLFREPCITNQVWRECQFDPARRDAQTIKQAFDAKVIVRVDARAPKPGSFPANLGEGETSSIILANKRRCLIAVDDRSARRYAKNIGLDVVGTVGILLHAKHLGVIASVREKVNALRTQHYYLSDDLIDKALELANE